MSEELKADDASRVADYVLCWLRSRNGAELQPALDNMRVCDANLMREELIMILASGGKPRNWKGQA